MKRLHWGFPDPASFQGTSLQKLERVRQIRDMIKERIEAWCEAVCPAKDCCG
jgi:arsenate reductase